MMFKQWIIACLLSFSLFTGVAFAADRTNLNTASAEELELLDGVGPATAAAIVEYREANGAFSTVDDYCGPHRQDH